MRLTLVILLVVGTSSLLVSAQDASQRRQARARFRALAEAARNGDVEAQNLLKSRRRNRTRPPQPTRSSAVPARPVFQDAVKTEIEPERPVRVRIPVRRTRVRVAAGSNTEAPPPTTTFIPITTRRPEPAFPVTEQEAFPTVFTEAPFFEEFSPEPVTEAPRTLFNDFVEETQAPARPRFRPQSRPAVQQPRQRFQQSRPVDDFNGNFDIEPHRALNTGLEIDSRSEHIIPRFGNDRTTEPPVETIRRYSFFDEEGNYVFGYEAADGSFKEEIRGLDCVVNGKYGYVDPEGIRREFTYTSGNKCDPNAVVDPETQEAPVLPLNDQFLQQTQERKLTPEELEQVHFNRRRKPVTTAQPEQRPVSDNRRRQQNSRPSTRPVSRPVSRPAQRPQQVFRPAQEPQQVFTPVQEPQQVFRPVTDAPIRATPAPAPVFTTPSSFNRFTTPESLRPSQDRFPSQQQEVRRPKPTKAPVVEQTRKAFQPPEGPSFRPTPKPIAFNFDNEFNNLFSHFNAPRPQTTRRPVFTTPRPTPPTTRRPPPPPPTTRPPTFRPVTTSPVTSRPPITNGASDVANQLVFDAATGTFKNVPVKTGSSNNFLPRPAPNPFAPRPATPSRPPTPTQSVQNTFSAPRPQAPSPSPAPIRPSTVGVPLPSPTQPAAFNPASHFVINQNGRSPAAAEFDKFFSQFNLKF